MRFGIERYIFHFVNKKIYGENIKYLLQSPRDNVTIGIALATREELVQSK